MTTATQEKQLDDDAVIQFYLKSLESLDISSMDDKCDEFIHLYQILKNII